MNNPKKTYRFANDLYEKNANMLAVYDAQCNLLDDCDINLEKNFFNNFVLTCDLDGIKQFENIFNILADETTETLEFRKQRIIERFSNKLPYTKFTLYNFLNKSFGEENVNTEIVYNDYDIKIGVENVTQSEINRVIKELRREILPANMLTTDILYEPYMHRYLRKYFTYEQMEELTYGELSQYAT